MDRVVLLAKQQTADGRARRKEVILLSASICVICAAVSFSLDGEDEPSFPLQLASWSSVIDLNRNRKSQFFIDFIIATIILWITCRLYQWLFHPLPFMEALVEVTPLGVQLVSVYGTDDTKIKSTKRPASPPAYYTANTQFDEKHKNRNDIQYKIRAFLPRHQILDVIVMEVVWPHCVWSQLAFRIVNGSMDKLPNGSYKTKVDVPGEGEVKDDGGENTPKSKCHDKGCKSSDDQSTQKSTQQRIRQSSQSSHTKTPPIHRLLQKNRVSIIPAFPEECQGMLTYEQCLSIQAEIERLLGHHSG